MTAGLQGVVAGETELSQVDGDRGELILRGHRVEDLAGRIPFEAVVVLLLDGALPSARASEASGARLGQARVEAARRLPSLHHALGMPDPMSALRAGLSALSSEDDDGLPWTLIGAAAVFACAWDRVRRGLPPVPPRPGLGHAADLLAMLDGTPPGHARAAGLDAYLGTVVDHGFNASTFTARIVASTGSDLVSAVVAGLGALKGPLHGGAPGPVLDMLDAVGSPDRAVPWVRDELGAGRRIMGLGHRVYRVRDPRAEVLEGALARLLASDPGAQPRIAVAQAVEAAATSALRARHPGRPMYANVELATALLLDGLGIDRAMFPAVFACSRVAGWCAHALEQQRTGRLIRPASRYVGPRPAA
jgi:citrate synthase